MADLPDSLFADAAAMVKPYATALSWNGELVGSGTFVRINGRWGVLTAAHVWHAIDRCKSEKQEINLLVADGPHQFRVRVDHLIPRISLVATKPEWGPDIQFVELPAGVVGTIAARKSFVEITANAENYHAIAVRTEGFAMVIGFPEEFLQRSVMPDSGDALHTFAGGFVAPIDRHWARGAYDYMESAADRTLRGIPTTFGGVSGAGLWKMLLHKKVGAPMAEASLGDFALAGVAFYERPASPNKMILRYHGPKTIYKVLNKLVPKTSGQ